MIWLILLMLLIFNPGWYRVVVQVVDSMVLSCVEVLGHQQSYRSIGSGVVHKHTTHCTVLQMDRCQNAVCIVLMRYVQLFKTSVYRVYEC